MENQFTNSTNYTNQLGQQNNQQETTSVPKPPMSHYNQQPTRHAQQQQVPFPQQPMQQQQASQMMGQEAMYNQMAPQVLQIPEYSDEQKQMQQKIKMDAYGLLKKRGTIRLNLLIELIVVTVILIFMTIAFFQLSITGMLSGTDVRRFLTSEIYILDIVYFVLLVFGVIGIVFTSMLMSQTRKIRVDTVVNYKTTLKFAMLFTALFISGFFFMSSFWLMTSLATYWLIFILQIALAIAAGLFIFRVINEAEKIATTAKNNNLNYDNKPVSEAIYYQPISYRTVVHQPDIPYHQAPHMGQQHASHNQTPYMGQQHASHNQAPHMGQQHASHNQAPHMGQQHASHNQTPHMDQSQNVNTPNPPSQSPIQYDM